MAIAATTSLPPSREEVELARTAAQRLSALAHRGRPLTLQLREAGREETIELPAAAVNLLAEILEQMAAGRAVAVAPREAELTTQQAADFLNVSRPFLIRLLEEKKIPFRKVGTHRRVRFEDVARYKQSIDAERRRCWICSPPRPRSWGWAIEPREPHGLPRGGVDRTRGRETRRSSPRAISRRCVGRFLGGTSLT